MESLEIPKDKQYILTNHGLTPHCAMLNLEFIKTQYVTVFPKLFFLNFLFLFFDFPIYVFT